MLRKSQFSSEDMAVIGKVLATLGELGITLLLQDLVPVMWDYGPYRLYQWEAITRDDEPVDSQAIQVLLTAVNSVGQVKPQVYSIEEYPAEEANFHRAYLTVYI